MKTKMTYNYIVIRMAKIKRLIILRVGQDVEEQELSHKTVGNVNGRTLENSLAIS